MMNADLFARIDDLHARQAELGLGTEQARVLTLYHRMFVRAGARLHGADRDRLKAVLQRLASLGTAFGQNVLADEQAWALALSPDDLIALPDDLVAAAAAAAAERGQDGHVITLSRSLVVPFLQTSPRRDLREKAFRAWVARGENGGATDNRAVVAETLALREERARLLGYPDFASYKLEPEMAKTPAVVRDLLLAVWAPARTRAEADAERLEELMHADGINGSLEAWDWRYYAAIRQAREHDFDQAALKPYLPLDGVLAGAFDVASRLFGLSFHPVEVALYHPDARAWEVRRGQRHMGVFIGDYFARSSKRSGAWCSSFRGQNKLDGEGRPIVVNICNFAKAPEGEASLLTFDDAHTLFHEMGHALHGLLSDVTYEFISGTSVARDFAALPSQLYEHWLETPAVLEAHARHVTTGAAMPRELRDRVIAARNFDQGFATVEYLASALVDLNFHAGPAPADPMAAQGETLSRLGMPRAIVMRHATPHFQHVFAGDGYSSGYYSYMWSEVMDADAFAAFRETGDVFDPATAKRLVDCILSAGGSRDAADLYMAFRGRMPGVEALLEQRGLKAA
jgi:peptidyl-dipeptidase Dcp